MSVRTRRARIPTYQVIASSAFETQFNLMAVPWEAAAPSAKKSFPILLLSPFPRPGLPIEKLTRDHGGKVPQ